MGSYHDIERPDFTPDYITELKPDEVFVFGSNLAGMHGGGAAYIAFKQFGAVMGCGVGLRGQSYAILNKRTQNRTHFKKTRPVRKERHTTLFLDIVQS